MAAYQAALDQPRIEIGAMRAITGHATPAMVQKYSKAADQRRLAGEAMAKLIQKDRAT